MEHQPWDPESRGCLSGPRKEHINSPSSLSSGSWRRAVALKNVITISSEVHWSTFSTPSGRPVVAEGKSRIWRSSWEEWIEVEKAGALSGVVMMVDFTAAVVEEKSLAMSRVRIMWSGAKTNSGIDEIEGVRKSVYKALLRVLMIDEQDDSRRMKKMELYPTISHNNGVLVLLLLSQGSQATISCHVLLYLYDHVIRDERNELWRDLRRFFLTTECAPWIILGDFNVVRTVDERVGGVEPDQNEMADFNQCLMDIQVQDMCSKGLFFTWINHTGEGDCIFSRIYRVLQNDV
ncbi:hypothetical protein LguiB_021351 [Lonicera macranthoides]